MFEPIKNSSTPQVENYTFHSAGMPGDDLLSHDDAVDAGIGSDHKLDNDVNSNLHKRLLSYYTQEIYVQSEQRTQMQRDEAYYDGDQWTDADDELMKDRGPWSTT